MIPNSKAELSYLCFFHDIYRKKNCRDKDYGYVINRYYELLAKEPVSERSPTFMQDYVAYVNQTGLNPFIIIDGKVFSFKFNGSIIDKQIDCQKKINTSARL
ncbi:hypothetical protein [Streptococcus ferus]|uniref:hypothetical protein n=1 Tax=Streptococcus ferus TaxID=1345 RepID=UPI0023578094|nr:hypothetical protein [Streptococcus ferus]